MTFLLLFVIYYYIFRLVKALEDVYRTTALQEFRRKRDQLALNCVRLGKISTLRTVISLLLSRIYYFILHFTIICICFPL